MTKEIFLNKKQWKNFNEKEMIIFQESVFNYYRKKGFPYYPTNEVFKKKEYRKLTNYTESTLLKNKMFQQTMHGLGLAWSYFPHSWEVKCNDLKTPFEVFHNDDDFKKVINKRILYGDNISDSGIRKTLRVYTGTQAVSNFKPTTAKTLYNLFAENGVVYDMSCGFGGRLLGFLSSSAKTYIGVEPATKTYNGLLHLKQDYNDFLQEQTISLFDQEKKDIQIYQSGSESFKLPKKSVDFCFTSPPYFNCEKYSNEETQSYLKFPTKELWLNGFLRQTFENCHCALKDNKYMAINIANVSSFPNLETETINLANKCGFILMETYYYLLSSLSKKNKFKKEPIFVFKKI